jgi:hypothetical protein
MTAKKPQNPGAFSIWSNQSKPISLTMQLEITISRASDAALSLKMLVDGERRHVDEIAALRREFFRPQGSSSDGLGIYAATGLKVMRLGSPALGCGFITISMSCSNTVSIFIRRPARSRRAEDGRGQVG